MQMGKFYGFVSTLKPEKRGAGWYLFSTLSCFDLIVDNRNRNQARGRTISIHFTTNIRFSLFKGLHLWVGAQYLEAKSNKLYHCWNGSKCSFYRLHHHHCLSLCIIWRRISNFRICIPNSSSTCGVWAVVYPRPCTKSLNWIMKTCIAKCDAFLTSPH